MEDLRFFRSSLPTVEDLGWPYYWQLYFKVEWPEDSEEAILCGTEYTTLVKLAPKIIDNKFFIESYQDEFLTITYLKKALPDERDLLSNVMDKETLIRPVRIDENMNIIPCEWKSENHSNIAKERIMKGKIVRPVTKFNGLFSNSKGYVLGESIEYPYSWAIAWYPAKAPFVTIHDEEDFYIVDEEYDFSNLKKIYLDFSDIICEEDVQDLKGFINP